MDELEKEWNLLIKRIESIIGKKPADLNAVLFLIGVQELGKGPLNFSKEQKQDLLHIATCKLLSLNNYYILTGIDDDGWPHWEKAGSIPRFTVKEQELLLKQNAILYFKEYFK
ncbi:hypothetical protein HZR84_07760 [Hyphobacterium sp. CCMP332]|nr:hypothetical protein HZR84_07760 [Hyphobacterium sp. CCMP332]